MSKYDRPPKVAEESVVHGIDGSDISLAAKQVPKFPKRRPNNELAELRKRARTAGATARTSVSLQVRASVELYKALVELAEEYHQPISVIARQCLEDGARKYRDFSTPGLNPFGRVPVSRSHPQLLQRPSSLASRLAPTPVRNVVEPDEEDVEVAGLENYAEQLSKLPPGLVLPSAPPLSETHSRTEDTGIFEEPSEETND
jgi:hypothetical protein